MSATFTELEAPNTYTVTVAAVNRAGNSSSVEGGIHFQGKLELAYIPTVALYALCTVQLVHMIFLSFALKLSVGSDTSVMNNSYY